MRRLFVPVALAALLATACGDDARTGNAGATTEVASDDTTAPSTPETTATPVDTATPEDAAMAPEALQFTAPVVGGGELDLRTYAGQTVAFWFWAPT